MSDYVGKTIRGYEMRKLLGEGGFGAVYSAYQPLLKRDVAIKVVLPKYANEPDFIRRFEVEAELVARLEHPHIVPLYDYWREPDGAYIVMRLLRGGSARNAMQSRQFTLEEIADLLDQVASALNVAHREGVIHRDIKPDNILQDVDSNFYLGDFGIAKRIDGEYGDAEDEGISGSLHYIPPEQIQGMGVSPQTDIYALGMMLYELVAGQHPYVSKTISEIIMAHLQEPLPDVSIYVPGYPALNEVIQKATAKEPENRHSSALELARDFRVRIMPNIAINVFDQVDLDLPNPYKGLQAFQENDSEKFFGRTALVEQLLARLCADERHQNFLAVIGASGSGKSSVVKAGLIPALRAGCIPGSENGFIVDMFPGSQPFQELASALLRVAVKPMDNLAEHLAAEDGLTIVLNELLPAASTLTLVIDQFEELFTQVDNENVRARFIDNLVKAFEQIDARLRVIVTLRADFYDKPLQYRVFGEILRQRMETVLPLSPQELVESISRPAELVGAAFEPGLVDVIVADVGAQPGVLPLLQYALTELFERRTGSSLRLGAYQQIGGVVGALARRAEEVYRSLDPDGQQAARQMFMRLVTPGESAEDTRRRVRRSELPDTPLMDRVIEVYGKSRLLTFDREQQTRESTIEVAHEAIIRTWQRVRDWVNENREALLQQRRLTVSAQEWQAAKQDPAYLATGARLAQFESLFDADIALNQLEETYLRESVEHREEKKLIDEARKEHELRLQRQAANRLRYLVGVMATFLLIAVGLWQTAQNSEAVAVAARATAVRREIVSSSRALSERLNEIAENEPFKAYALARDLLVNVPDIPMVVDSAAMTTLINTRVMQRIESPEELWRVAHFTPDGTQIVAGTTTGGLSLWNVADGSLAQTYEQGAAEVLEIIPVPDSSQFISINVNREVFLWNIDSPTPARHLFESLPGLRSLAFTPDGKHVLLGNGGGFVSVVDFSTGEVLRQFKAHDSTIFAITVSPDGTRGASGASDNMVTIFDYQTGTVLHKMAGHTNPVFDVEITPNARYLISTSTDSLALVWDMETGEQFSEINNHRDAVFDSVVTQDGRFVLTVSQDEMLMIHRLRPVASLELSGHSDAIFSVDISQDQKRALTASSDGTIVVWSLDVGQRYDRFPIDATSSRGVRFMADGNSVFVNLDDQYIVRWDWRTGEILQRYEADTDTYILSVDIVPDKDEILTGTEDGRMLRFDISSGELLAEYRGHDQRVWSGIALPDGRRALTGSLDTRALLWDLETGEILQEYKGVHTDEVITAMPSPDQSVVTTASADGTIGVWNLKTGQLIKQLEGHTRQVIATVFSPDGRLMLSHSLDGSIIVWDTQTWQMLRVLDGHDRAVMAVRFLPGEGGRYAVSGSLDETMVLWDVLTGEIVRQFEGNGSPIRNLDVSPDGEYAVPTTRDGDIFLWWIDPNQETVLAWADQNLSIPALTCEDRVLYQTPIQCETS